MSDSLSLSAISFAYAQFGRHVAPESPTEWLKRPALQNKQLRSGKGCIVMRESGAEYFTALSKICTSACCTSTAST